MAEAEYWRFTVARDCQKKNTSETHSGYSLLTPAAVRTMIVRAILLAGFAAMAAADLEADVRAFYQEHDASKLHKVSTVLFRYKGK